MTKECKQCGAVFSKPKSCSLKNWEQRKKFCSRKCVYAWMRDNDSWITKKQRAGLELGRGLFKGKSRKNVSGARNGNWKGGKTPLFQAIRNSKQYTTWRSSVLARDDYTCQECGQRGYSLNVDHVISLAQIVYDSHVSTIEDAKKCSSMWDTNNGKTLCVACHEKTPTYKKSWVMRTLRHTSSKTD